MNADLISTSAASSPLFGRISNSRMRIMERCENCQRIIGDLETPMLYCDHVVCRECREQLIVAEQPDPNGEEDAGFHVELPPPPRPEPEILFHEDRIWVTSEEVVGPRCYRLEELHAVRPEEHIFGKGMTVYLRDLVGETYGFEFKTHDSARRFIAAIVEARGSIIIEREQVSWGLWWGW
jgi:hypothetical protein